MKQKYIIRETSVPFDPPYMPLYFHGFTTRSAGVCLVFGSKLAAEYDTLKAAGDTLVKVKELSGRNSWDVEPKFKAESEFTWSTKIKDHFYTPFWDDLKRERCKICGWVKIVCVGERA